MTTPELDKYKHQMTNPTPNSNIGQPHLEDEDVQYLFMTTASSKSLSGLAPGLKTKLPLERDSNATNLSGGKQHTELPKPLTTQHNSHSSPEQLLGDRLQDQARATDDQQVSYNSVPWDTNGAFQQNSSASLCLPILSPGKSVRRNPAVSDYSNPSLDWTTNEHNPHSEVEHVYLHQLVRHSDAYSPVFENSEYDDSLRHTISSQNRPDEVWRTANSNITFPPNFPAAYRETTRGTQEVILNQFTEYPIIGEASGLVREDIGSHPDDGHVRNQYHVPLTPYASLVDQRHPQNSFEGKGAEDKSSSDFIRTKGVSRRRFTACTNCRRLKMKCALKAGQGACNRCRNLRKVCIIEERELRQNTKCEPLIQELANKDLLIGSLLRQIHKPATPGLFGDASTGPTSHSIRSIDRSPDRSVLPWIDLIKRSWNPPSTQQNDDHQDLQSKLDPPHPPHAHPGKGPNQFKKNSSMISFAATNLSELGELDMSISRRQTNAELCYQSDLFSLSALPTGSSVEPKTYEQLNAHQSHTGTIYVTEGENEVLGVRKAADFGAQLIMGRHLSKIPTKEMSCDILIRGIITSADVEALFQIFFDKLNASIAILDPKVHTPAFVLERCSFLFTTVCAVASRYHQKGRSIYMNAIDLAENSATTILSYGCKSVEVVQAFLLMVVFSAPARGAAEDRVRFYLNTATSMALDLNLNSSRQSLKATGECHEWEILNRARTWLVCFNINQSGSTGLGRRTPIQEDDIVRNSPNWYKNSEYK
ncbi:Fungal Zn(2)-Cys(6) binuclear cluster domain [Ceratobasidium sp. AG-Ba]|nr:Fungal Zn(2)-Cys(6) binuclear cluster domain [Ceratobasidium sp. AG-Ba]